MARWTEKEIDILKEYYVDEGARIEGRLPGRTVDSIHKMASRLGLVTNKRYGPRSAWLDTEDAVLLENRDVPVTKLQELMPWRSVTAIRQRRRDLGIADNGAVPWTEEECEILRKYYEVEGSAVHKRLPGRTAQACAIRSRQLGLWRGSELWTEEEDDIIREFFVAEGGAVASRLPGRTPQSCRDRASKLGVTMGIRKVWTKSELKLLRKYYATEGGAVCKRLPGRSDNSCRMKACRLGLVFVGLD